MEGTATRPLWPHLLWIIVGTLLAFGVAGLLTVGVYLIPIAAILGVIGLSLRTSRSASALSGLIGAGAVALYIGWLNRGGPGTVCETSQATVTCIEQWSPWPFVLVGAALILAGLWLPWKLSRTPSPELSESR